MTSDSPLSADSTEPAGDDSTKPVKQAVISPSGLSLIRAQRTTAATMASQILEPNA